MRHSNFAMGRVRRTGTERPAWVGRAAVLLVLLASATLVLLGTRSFYRHTARIRPVVVPFDLFWCSKDEDCVVLDRIGCCPCTQGGGQAAITRWHRDELRRFLKKACRQDPQVCVQVNVCRNDWLPRCVDRRCQLVLPAEDADSSPVASGRGE